MEAPLNNNSQPEIERKFLVTASPLGPNEVGTEILQAYIAVGRRSELRVRIAAGSAMLTFKGPRSGNVRLEWETELPLSIAEELYQEAEHGRIHKHRYPYVAADGHLWTIDVFDESIGSLILAEIELESPFELIELPDWIGDEVTDDERYYNRNIANPGQIGNP